MNITFIGPSFEWATISIDGKRMDRLGGSTLVSPRQQDTKSFTHEGVNLPTEDV